MKVLLIDPETQTIKEIEIEKGIKAIYEAMDCEMFECPIYFDNGDVLYCDEEGKLNREKLVGGFTYPKQWGDVIMNKALVIGTDHSTGDSVSCKSTPEYVKNAWGPIQFINKEKCEWALDKMGF